MVNLFDLIASKVGNIGDKVGSFSKSLTTPNAPTLPVIQLADNGEIDYQKSFDETQKQPRGMWEHLTGRTITMDADSTDPETGKMTTQRIAKFQPGFFNNLASGAKENFATGFAAPNLTDNTGGFGKKSASYRLGEGLGTLGRFLESPLGRGVIAYGLSNYYGDRNPMVQGLTALVGNQGNRMRDRAYREQLEGMGVDTSNIRGYITDDVYKNIVSMKQLKDNADYRNALLETQQNNQLVSQQMALDELKYKQQKDARDYNLKNRELDLKEQQILNDNKGEDYKNPKIILRELEQAWDLMPQSKAIKGTSKAKAIQTGISANLGIANNDTTAYLALRDSMVTPLARAISQEKGNISDSDVKRAKAMLPDEYDSYEQGKARLNAVSKLLIALERGEVAPANAEKYLQVLNNGSQASPGNTTKSGVKYEVID